MIVKVVLYVLGGITFKTMARRQVSGDVMGSRNSHQEGKRDDEENENKLFIKNIPLAVDGNWLRSLVGRWGKVVQLRVVMDRKKPDVQFAILMTETRADAVQILSHLDGFRIENSVLRVVYKKSKSRKAICIVPPFSPSEFYSFLKSDQQKLVDLEIRLYEFYSVPENQRRPKSLPKVRDICVCQFSADNLWYRAEVEAVAGQKITVRYVDYGNKEDTSVASMCEIADQFKSTPYLTVRCRLADVEPLGPGASGDAWSEKAIGYIQEAVPQCVVLTMIAFCIKDDVYHVELLLPDGTNVAEKLIDAGLARRPPQQAAPASSPVQTSRSPDEKQRAEVRQRFADYGWPSDPNHLIGRRMTAEIVDCDPRGELWIRFDPLPGHTAPPRMRVLASESCLFAERHRGHVNGSLAEVEAAKPDPKARRCLIQDLPELELQNMVKVEVTFVQDAGTFYCQDLLQMTKLVELQQNWTAPDPRSLSAYVPEEKEICLGFYEKYGEWYRVEVLDQLDRNAFVFMTDYGKKMRLPLTSLLPLPKELSDFPPLAFHCQLSAWSMLKASPYAQKLFKEIVTGKPLTCEILSRDQTMGVRSVILSDLQSAQSVMLDLFAALERKAL